MESGNEKLNPTLLILVGIIFFSIVPVKGAQWTRIERGDSWVYVPSEDLKKEFFLWQEEEPSELIDGSTSFNGSGIPYEGTDVLVQAGNSHPKFQLVPSSSIADIRLGAGAYSSYTWSDLPNLDKSLNNFIEYGTYRLDTSVGEVEEPIFWEYRWEDEFPEAYDQFIDGLNENGVAVNYMLHFWDKSGHESGEELSTPRFQTEEQIQDFLDYVRFVASHYNGSVQYYTIWSEPDACPGIKCIEAEDYINLVRRTVPVIHKEDPQAKVSIAPNVLFFAQEYLSAILKSDIMTMVDVIQWHGIYNVLPIDPFYGDYYYQYPAIIEGIKQTAAAHGFDGEYWATEISYCSEEFPHCHAPDQPWGLPKTDKQAAKYSSRAIVMHLGMDIGVAMLTWLPDIPEMAPWTHPTTSNLYKILAGTKPISLAVEIESESANTLTNTFVLPNGDTLFALWTHGEAIDDDPGVSTTLTFPGLSARQVIAIDALNGFEQDLIIEVENGNLVIRNMFVMDYPIILRIPHTPTINNPSDITYEEGNIGNTITWTPTDDNPMSYTITRDGIEIESDNWNGGDITVNVDGLSTGTYTYICTVTDVNNQTTSDTVFVTVTTPTTSNPTSTTTTTTTGGISVTTPGFELAATLVNMLPIVVMIVVTRKQKKKVKK